MHTPSPIFSLTRAISIKPAPPLGLEKLLKQLDHHRLPIRQDAQQALLAAIHKPTATAESLAPLIKCEPVLCLRLLLIANNQLNRSGNQVHHLYHAISLLGLPQLELILKATPVVTELPTGLAELLQQSYMSARLCDELQLAPSPEQELLFLSALFLRVHEWCLWFQYPQVMQQLQQLCINPKTPKTSAEQATLGCLLDTLGQRMIEHLGLPSWTKAAAKLELQQLLPAYACLLKQSPPRVARFFSRQSLREQLLFDKPSLLLCANAIMRSANLGWYQSKTLRAQQLLARISYRPLPRIISACHQLAISSPMFNLTAMHPGLKLISAWDARLDWVPADLTSPPSHVLPASRPKTQNQVQPTAIEKWGKSLPADNKQDLPMMAEISEGPFSNNTLLEANLRRLNKQGASFSNLNQLLLCCLESLHEGLGCAEVVIMVLNTRRDQLRSHFSAGLANEHPLRTLSLDTEALNNGIIGKLLRQTGALQIQAHNRRQAARQLPTELSQYIQPDQCGFMSLVYQNQPLALVYIHKDPLTSADFEQFKQLCQATSQGISGFARQKK